MRSDSGQAAVETAITLPLVLFCVLGTLQLFLLMHARLIAEYAVYRAVRAGSLAHGDCEAMKSAALVSVLPAVTATETSAKLSNAYRLRRSNRYAQAQDGGHDGQVVELWRESPRVSDVADPEDRLFDQPGHLMRLEARMVFWYRLTIPLADWVLQRMWLAHWQLKPYTNANPLEPANRAARWDDVTSRLSEEPWPGGSLASSMLDWESRGHRLFPIRVSWGMRLMTPARHRYFGSAGCAL